MSGPDGRRVLSVAAGERDGVGGGLDGGPAGPRRARVDLPTYAFEHQHYWLRTTPAADAVALGRGWARWIIRCSAAAVGLPGAGG